MPKANLLIIEDDPLQRRLVKENLETEDFTVFEAVSGKAAMEIVKEYPIDIAIVVRVLPA